MPNKLAKSILDTPLKNCAKRKKEEKKIKLYSSLQLDWVSASPNFVWYPKCSIHGFTISSYVPQVTRLLLGDAIISSKTYTRSGNKKKKKKSYGKVRNNKKLSTILLFIRILYLKQQINILRCYCSLNFEKSLFSNKFFSLVFRSKMIVHAEKEQVKYFAQNKLGKITLFYLQTAAWPSCCCHKWCLFNSVESYKILFY